MESCRKLASSVKISDQCRDWAFFFKGGIDAAVPSVLSAASARASTRRGRCTENPQPVKQFAHMARMILNPELLLD